MSVRPLKSSRRILEGPSTRLATAPKSWTTVTDGYTPFADRKKTQHILLLATSKKQKQKNLFLDCQLLVVQSLMSSYERLAWTQYLQQQWKYFDSDQIQSAGNPKPTVELKTKPIIFIYLFVLLCFSKKNTQMETVATAVRL